MLQSKLGEKLLFSRVYCGRDHGFTAASFHEHCDDVSGTVTLIKAKSGAIFGGYASGAWSSPSRPVQKHCDVAFLFTVPTCGGRPPTVFPVVTLAKAMYCGRGSGPGFGADIRIHHKAYSPHAAFSGIDCSKFPCNYSGEDGETFTGTDSCELQDLEVWKVVTDTMPVP